MSLRINAKNANVGVSFLGNPGENTLSKTNERSRSRALFGTEELFL
jgi:hypothetical protein